MNKFFRLNQDWLLFILCLGFTIFVYVTTNFYLKALALR